MYFVYVLYSEKLHRFYTGSTHDVDGRLEKHNSDYYNNKWTARGKPWKLFLSFSCQSKTQALQIEQFIKKMKSKKFIQKLKEQPEIIEDLKQRFPSSG